MQNKNQRRQGSAWQRVKKAAGRLGPGFITGASDDDPSGIGTYAQTGAGFGYAQLWTALCTFPLMAAVQEMCARIALQTGGGLVYNLRRSYPRGLLYLAVGLLTLANTVNIGADLGAMAASAQLLVQVPFIPLLVFITLLAVLLEVFVPYASYAKVLRVLALSLLAYVFAAFVVPQDWVRILQSTLIPSAEWSTAYLMNVVAILGTTISPYLFFWQAGEEMEEEVALGRRTVRARRGMTRTELRWMHTDIISGMFFSNVAMFFIMVTAASTLAPHGITTIESAPQAAEALRPIAGNAAFLLFAAGIIGTGLLAVPVLAGATAYAVAELFHWREGLFQKLRQAHGFYAVIMIATFVGATMNFLGINPMRALYYTAVLNGLVAPPLLFMILHVARSKRIMRQRVNGPLANVLGWTAWVLLSSAGVALLFMLVR